jgi:hypothetical protein
MPAKNLHVERRRARSRRRARRVVGGVDITAADGRARRPPTCARPAHDPHMQVLDSDVVDT